MIDIERALSLVLEQARPLPPVAVPLQDCLGHRLAETVSSTINSPPHDKSLVDGYAVQSHDPADELRVIEEVTAGEVPRHPVTPGTASRVMTGAPVPEGADAVVMHERTKSLPENKVRICDPTLAPRQFILPTGTSFRQGDTVLEEGTRLRPIEIGVLAELGRSSAMLTPPPSVSILATGNELVPCDQEPGPGKIRNSNGPLLTACVAEAGGIARDGGIVGDEAPKLQNAISKGLESNILLTSGGVSAGKLDLVPDILAEMGVEKIFHKVRLKPGKPLWFGVLRHEESSCRVFGLPGNPVSAFVCFCLFVRPAIRQLAGESFVYSQSVPVELDRPLKTRGARPTYRPAWIDWSSSLPSGHPVSWHGSADLAAFAKANALLIVPDGEHEYRKGSKLDAMRLG